MRSDTEPVGGFLHSYFKSIMYTYWGSFHCLLNTNLYSFVKHLNNKNFHKQFIHSTQENVPSYTN